MNIQQATHQLETAVRCYTARDENGMPLVPPEAQRPLFLIGPPGVGKTDVVAQVARRLGVGLVSYTMTHHTRQSALGLPQIRTRRFGGEERAVTEYTMSELLSGVYRHMEASGCTAGILFLDEINCVSETLTPAMLELLQHKRFGEYALPEGWVIVCAGNPEKYNRAAHAFDPVTLDRLRVLTIEPDLAAWQEYAAQRQVHPSVRGYLRLRPEDFFRAEGERIVTARSWMNLSDMMLALERSGGAADALLFGQYLQCGEVAERFALYHALCRGVASGFSLDAVLQGRDEAAEARFAQAGFDEALCAAMLLSDALNARIRSAEELRERAQRLRYFAEGAIREQGSGTIIDAARENLSRMEKALAVRRSVNAISSDEEARERALHSEIRACIAALYGAEDAQTALMEQVCLAEEDAMNKRRALVRELSHALDFAERAFTDVHVRVIFLSELERNDVTLRFLKANLPEPLEALRSGADPDRRAKALRQALAGENLTKLT